MRDAGEAGNAHAVGVDPRVDEQLRKLDGRALDGHGQPQLDEAHQHEFINMEELKDDLPF